MSAARRIVRRSVSCSRGAAAVEFAMISGLLIMLLIGVLDFGRALYAQNQISFLAEQAIRRVLIEPDVTAAELESELREGFTAGNPQALEIEIVPESQDGATFRVVRIDFPFALLIPGIDADQLSLGVTRRVPEG